MKFPREAGRMIAKCAALALEMWIELQSRQDAPTFTDLRFVFNAIMHRKGELISWLDRYDYTYATTLRTRLREMSAEVKKYGRAAVADPTDSAAIERMLDEATDLAAQLREVQRWWDEKPREEHVPEATLLTRLRHATQEVQHFADRLGRPDAIDMHEPLGELHALWDEYGALILEACQQPQLASSDSIKHCLEEYNHHGWAGPVNAGEDNEEMVPDRMFIFIERLMELWADRRSGWLKQQGGLVLSNTPGYVAQEARRFTMALSVLSAALEDNSYPVASSESRAGLLPQVDQAKLTITLPGGDPCGLTEVQFRMVQRIIQNDGGWIAGRKLKEFEDSSEHTSNVIRKLPSEIRAHIESKRGTGYRWLRSRSVRN